MANIRSAIKRIRSSERRRKVNQIHRAEARTFVKKTRRQLDAGRLSEAEATIQEAISALDKAAQKGVIHKNNAARRKSRLMKQLNQAREKKA